MVGQKACGQAEALATQGIRDSAGLAGHDGLVDELRIHTGADRATRNLVKELCRGGYEHCDPRRPPARQRLDIRPDLAATTRGRCGGGVSSSSSQENLEWVVLPGRARVPVGMVLITARRCFGLGNEVKILHRRAVPRGPSVGSASRSRRRTRA